MLFFRNDYGQGCIPEILEQMNQTNMQSHVGYGEDEICMHAKQLIQSKMVDHTVDVHFISGGTLTNQTVIKSMLRPFEAVISCDTGHIATHETGAIEATGHKVITVQNVNGKLTPALIQKSFDEHMLTYEHLVYPKMVYISNATEFGTVYTREELTALHEKCQELGLYLYMDGARLGAALMSGVDYSLNDLAAWCDVFYIGGTKNGALMGEAVVIINDSLKPYFRFCMKQNGAMMAKGWLLGIQFAGLFENDAFYTVAKHANEMAAQIQDALFDLKYPFLMKSDTNQIFPFVNENEYVFLKEKVDFELWENRKEGKVIRFVTSWSTTQEQVDALITLLKQAKELKEE